MRKDKLRTFDELVDRLNQDPEFRKEDRRQKPYYDIIIEIIRGRRRLGLTQKELAKKAKTHQSRISRIESGEYDLRLSTLIKIAEALDSSVAIRFAPIIEPPPITNGISSEKLQQSFFKSLYSINVSSLLTKTINFLEEPLEEPSMFTAVYTQDD